MYKLGLMCLLLLIPACAPAEPTPLTPVIVQLSFSHQAEFAGLYVADQLGYFASEGLAVTFREGGPQVNFITPLVDGTAEFGVASPADVILARADGKLLKAIAVVYRRSPIVFFSHADSGIKRPQDFVGKTIRSTLTLDLTLRAMLQRENVRPDQYNIVYLPSDVSRFAARDVPIWGGYLNVLVVDVQRAGYDINIIFPDDYGIHFFADVLITRDELISKNPELVRRFLRATLKGWKYAVENPNAIPALVVQYNPNADRALEEARMLASLPLVNTGKDQIGWIEPERWTGMESTLRAQRVLTKTVNIADVFTTQFLQEIYTK